MISLLILVKFMVISFHIYIYICIFVLYNRHIAKHDVLRKTHDALTGFTSRCWGWSYRKIVVSESIDRKRRFRKFGKNVQSSRWKPSKRPNLHLQNSTGCINYVTWNFESLFIQTFPSSILDKFCTFFQVEGGSIFSIKASWSQQILYQTDRFCLRIPFNFPSYVNPVGKKISKTEKISLNINPGTAAEVLCKSSSHPLKVKSYYHKFPLSCWIYIWFTNYWYVSSSCLQNLKRQGNKLSSSYEAEVVAWSSSDFNFAYTVRILSH